MATLQHIATSVNSVNLQQEDGVATPSGSRGICREILKILQLQSQLCQGFW
jgi:hypothetical protein